MKKHTAPRIIGGSLKGFRLKSIPGNQTRPITDRVKENLFNIIGNDIIDSSFLDAFSGTGSVGIEAYSRGAEFIQFIEKDKKSYSILNKNLEYISNQNAFSFINTDAFIFLSKFSYRRFDYIFIAPPQYHRMWIKALKIIDDNKYLLNDDGWIIIQIDPVEYESIQLLNFYEFEKRKYGRTLLVFFIPNTI
jgi:16S rRNA (guanine(966)-N(2))-methyltransferase RsmD